MCYNTCMNQTITIKTRSEGRRIVVELDADKFERLASNLGLYSPDFLRSIDRAEADYRAGRVRHVASLRDLRKKK